MSNTKTKTSLIVSDGQRPKNQMLLVSVLDMARANKMTLTEEEHKCLIEELIEVSKMYGRAWFTVNLPSGETDGMFYQDIWTEWDENLTFC